MPNGAFNICCRGAPIIPRDAVSRTAHVGTCTDYTGSVCTQHCGRFRICISILIWNTWNNAWIMHSLGFYMHERFFVFLHPYVRCHGKNQKSYVRCHGKNQKSFWRKPQHTHWYRYRKWLSSRNVWTKIMLKYLKFTQINVNWVDWRIVKWYKKHSTSVQLSKLHTSLSVHKEVTCFP